MGPTMSPAQAHTAQVVLNLGGERPLPRAGLIDDLTARLREGTAEPLRRWSQNSLFLTKAQLSNLGRCEGYFKAQKEAPRTSGLIPAMAVGTVVHAALQSTHTHPHVPVSEHVDAAVRKLLADDRDRSFATFWSGLGVAEQSDLLVSATNTVMTFLDTWPAMPASWSPRFEMGMQAKVGALTLSCRADLVIGRPRVDGKQSMVVVDWKSSGLYEEHEGEADFYALVAALRFRVPPYRSLVYSLTSGETTALDVTEERLFAAADKVTSAVQAIVEVMEAEREPVLRPGTACGWCPLAATCPAAVRP